MTAARRQHQGRDSAEGFDRGFSLHIGSGLQEKRHDLLLSTDHSQQERAAPLAVATIDLSPRRQKPQRKRSIPIVGRIHQSGDPAARAGPNIGPRRQ